MENFVIVKRDTEEIIYSSKSLTMANYYFLAVDKIKKLLWRKDVSWLKGQRNCAYQGDNYYVSHISGYKKTPQTI